MVPEEGVEPTRYKVPLDFESSASASSATPGREPKIARPPVALKKHRQRANVKLLQSKLVSIWILGFVRISTGTHSPLLDSQVFPS